MIKVWKKEQLNDIELPIEVKDYIYEVIEILDENYGGERDVDKDLGGYILIVHNDNEIADIKENLLDGIIPEYEDSITIQSTKEYIAGLYLLSSDYSVVVISEISR